MVIGKHLHENNGSSNSELQDNGAAGKLLKNSKSACSRVADLLLQVGFAGC